MFRKILGQSEFVRNVLTLFTGTVLAQAIPILISPVLTRLFSPAEFGLIALFTSIVFPLATLATGRYELAVMLPAKDTDAVNVAGAALLMTLGVSLLLFLPAYFFNSDICDLLKSPEISSWLYFVPIAVFLTATYQVFSYWLLRKKAFRPSSVNKISQTTATSVSGIVLGKISIVGGLVVADLFGRIAGVLISVFQVIKSGFSFSRMKRADMKKLAVEHKDFPLYSSGPAFLNKFTLQMPTILVSMFFGSGITGFFNFSRQISGNSLLLISTSISQVFFEKIVSKKNAGEKILPLLYRLITRLSLVAVIYVVGVCLLAPVLFGFIFGSKWSIAGEYAAIMSFGFAIKFVVSPLSVIFPALDAIKKASWWQILYFCAIGSLLLFRSFSVINFLITYTAIEVVVYLLYLFLILREAGKFDTNLPSTNG